MLPHLSSPILFLLINYFLLSIYSQFKVQALSLSIPTRGRIEGQLIQIVPDGDQVIKHHLPFSESLDLIQGKSTISIGYASREPTKYYTRRSLPTLTVGQYNNCDILRNSIPFVPEISWFTKYLLPNINLIQFANGLVGPTGLLSLAVQLTSSTSFSFDKNITHRDVPCQVQSRLVDIKGQNVSMKLEIFIPIAGVQFHNVKTTFFSIKVTTFNLKDSSKTNNDGAYKLGLYRASFIIDFYNVDSFDAESDRFELIKEDFNLPFAKGCSEFLQNFQPYLPKQSFLMNYYQLKTSEFIKLAYDHSNGFLRKEWPSKSFNIWDLNEDLLYHVNENLLNNLNANVLYPGNIQTCSVLKVTDDKLNSAFRPFKLVGQSLDVLDFIGAKSLAYIGFGFVRDMPSNIYETILDEPPTIFSLTEEHLKYKNLFLNKTMNENKKVDYIVQFYILKSTNPDRLNEEQLQLAITNFWPAKIRIYIRFKSNIDSDYSIQFLDELEIYDFYSSLFGEEKNPVELFMAPECFLVDNDEELKIELSIKFDKFHDDVDVDDNDNYVNGIGIRNGNGIGKTKNQSLSKSLLLYNKNKLETFLIDDLIDLFQFSRMHLIQYRMLLLKNHINLDLTINNRNELKNLIYFGEGNLPNENAYESNRVVIYGHDEESCILFGSLISDISMVVYCPGESSFITSKCVGVYGENEPIIKNYNAPEDENNNNNETFPCQVYRYIPTESPLKAATSSTIIWDKFGLKEHRFINFEATIPPTSSSSSSHDNVKQSNNNVEQTIKLNGSVIDYDLRHEIKFEIIDNYMFANDQTENIIEQKHIKSYKTFNYKNQGDCEKMCNLDSTCRSYSYCRSKLKGLNSTTQDNNNNNQVDNNLCFWSTLDIRKAKVKDQLVHLTPSSDNNNNNKKVVTVNDNGQENDNNLEYNIEFSDYCNIYERNYLNLFRETDEIYSIKSNIINQFQTSTSPFDCAKQSVDLELEHKNHHVAMFAYCPTVNICLLDEQLFNSTSSSSNFYDDEDSNTINQNKLRDETLCKVYRKKYQTFFTISQNVFKLNEHQIEFEFKTIEECARACWIKFGQVCASFDYCSSIKSTNINDLNNQQQQQAGICLINQIQLDSDGKIKGISESSLLKLENLNSFELETRKNCLHYERDFIWDELNKEHSIGRHNIYSGNEKLFNKINNKSSFTNIMGTFLAYSFSLCAFFYGLFIGIRMNDKMESIKIIRQSISGESGGGSGGSSNNKKTRAMSQSQMFGFKSFQQNGDYLSTDDIYHDDIDQEIIQNNHPNAIKLSIINSNRTNE